MLSVAESMQQVAAALQKNLEKSSALSAKVSLVDRKVKALKMSGRARPTVLSAMGWLKELENALHGKVGFSAAVEKLRKRPRDVTRQQLKDSVDAEDDEGLYDKVKASMRDVYDAMTDMQASTEKVSAMGADL